MDMRELVEQIFKEIEVYNSHALFAISKQKYKEIIELIENLDQFEHKNAVLEEILKQINSLEEEERDFLGINQTTKMSNKELDVVKQMVCAPGEADSDEGIWEVARACLILGQYDTALREFNRLIINRFKPVSAAKNILRCHISMAAFDEAINRYKEWALSGLFSLGQLENIRTFLQELLYKNNVNRLITNFRIVDIDHEQECQGNCFIDIVGIKLTVNNASDTSRKIMLAVNYQNGSTFNVVVPKKNMELLKYLKVGQEIENLELYSSSVIFTERCLVCKTCEIKYGPRNGDYSICLKILDSQQNYITQHLNQGKPGNIGVEKSE